MTNDGYANGTSTSSYVNNQTIPTSGGVPVLTVSVSGNNDGIHYQSAIETFGVEYSNYLAYTYEAFTYTNIGGVVDVGMQYHRGEIGGYSAGAQLGAAILFGGAGVKAYKGITRYTSYTRLRDTTASYRKNTNYSISTTKEEFISNLEYNGYTTTNGKIYTNGGTGHYNIYDARTSNGFAGAEYKRSKRNYTKYSLGVLDL